MSVRNPQVIEGARGPRDQRDAQYGQVSSAPRPAGHNLIPEGKRVYQSTAAKYMLQLTAPEDLRLADGRLIRGAPPLRAIFSEYFLALDTKKDTERIKMLDESPYNRKNGGEDFWDYQSILDAAVDARRATAIQTLSNPADREAIIAALKAEGVDFELPKQKTAHREATPTANEV